MGEKAGIPMFLFPGSVGMTVGITGGFTGGVTGGFTGGFTIKTKKGKISKENGKLLQTYFTKAADNILLKHRVFQDCESHPMRTLLFYYYWSCM